MRGCESRSCSTAVACSLTDSRCGTIVFFGNMLSRSFGGVTRLPVVHVPFFSWLSEKGTAVMRDPFLPHSLDQERMELSAEQVVSLGLHGSV